jgi:hypothetical protein
VAGYIGVYLGRKNQAVAVPLLRGEFGASKEEIGRIASAGALAVFVVAARGGGVVAAPACSRSCKRNGFRNSGEGGGGNQLGRVHELVRLRGFRVVSAVSFSLTRVRETFNDWTVDFIRTEGGAFVDECRGVSRDPLRFLRAGGILFVGAMMGRRGVRGRARLLAGGLFGLCAVLFILPRLVPLGLGFTVPAGGLIGFLGLGPDSLLGRYFALQLRGAACAGTVAGIIDSLGYVAGLFAGAAVREGYVPDAIATPDEVSAGRSAPLMMDTNALRRGVWPLSSLVKIGDTPSDIAQGINAGAWTLGVALSGDTRGLAVAASAAWEPGERAVKFAAARVALRAAGANYAVDAVADYPPVLEEIAARIERGQRAAQWWPWFRRDGRSLPPPDRRTASCRLRRDRSQS